MQYLGTLAGEGFVLHNGLELTRAQFKFDGYSTSHAGVTCNGEIRMPAMMLKTIFPQRTMQLRTDEGRLLELRLSEKKIGPDQEAAHVDVRGEIPGNDKREWVKGRANNRPARTGVATKSDSGPGMVSKGSTYYSSFDTRQARSHRVAR
jgi:hypothetical protein